METFVAVPIIDLGGRRVRRPYTDLSNLTAPGMPCRRAFRSFCTASSLQSAQICVICGSVCGPEHYCATGRRIVPLEAFCELGDACVAPTQIYRTSPRLGCPVGARFVPSARRHRHNLGKSALSAARSADREILAPRVEELSSWRPLRTGRRMCRPYTDMRATRPVRRAWAFYGRRFLLLVTLDVGAVMG